MSRFVRPALFSLVLFVLFVGPAGFPSATAQTRPLPTQPAGVDPDGIDWSVCDEDGRQTSGAEYRICMPPDWWYNGDLVIWAHGYVAYNEPIEIPEDQLCLEDGTCIPDVVNTLGYGFATTSYSVNGLAVRQGLADVVDLVDVYTAAKGAPEHVFIVGASEGGLITALATERYPDVFEGGLAACGPIGDFVKQINYFGDFRVVFDYFFAEQLDPPMGSPIDIPQWLIDDWDNYWSTVISPTIYAPQNRSALRQLINVTHVPYDQQDLFNTVNTSIEDSLWYNVFATNDGKEKLGGQPYDNMTTLYSGSLDDAALNLGAERFAGEQVAIDEINTYYQTSGDLVQPLVTLHTNRDQQVPYWHETLYLEKAFGTLLHVNIPIYRYGHCQFETLEVLGAFGTLLAMAGIDPLDMEHVKWVLPDPADQAAYLRMVNKVYRN